MKGDGHNRHFLLHILKEGDQNWCLGVVVKARKKRARFHSSRPCTQPMLLSEVTDTCHI